MSSLVTCLYDDGLEGSLLHIASMTSAEVLTGGFAGDLISIR